MTPVYSYRIANQTTTTAGTGTISSSGTAVTGVSTAFTSQLTIGDVIHASGYNLVVTTITDATHLALVTAPTAALSAAAFTITTLAAGNLETLSIRPPKGTFKPYADTVNLGNGTARAMGRPVASWLWGFMSLTQRNTLRAYCTGKSARVYICTKVNDSSDSFVTYDAVMLWPDEEKKFAGRRTDFEVLFRDLIAL